VLDPQAPNPGNYSRAQYTVKEFRGVMVPMRDGVRLSSDIYMPRERGQLPAILSMTPYGKNDFRDEARWFASRGYVYVGVDVRGRYDSEGKWDPFGADNKTDGYDLIEWIANQPWSNGKVGMTGYSYMAWTQWWTATTAPPNLVAIAPRYAPPDAFYNDPYQNGVLSGGWLLDWAAYLSGRTNQVRGAGAYGGWVRDRGAFKDTPYININARRGLEDAPWFKKWYEENKSTDPYWSAIAYEGKENFAKVIVPSLSLSGWFDVSQPGTTRNYAGMKRYGGTPAARDPFMIIGPWIHGGESQHVADGIDYGAAAVMDSNAYVARWFDHYLKGINNGVENDMPVHVFVMGVNRWRAALEWPLSQTEFTKYYLSSRGHANSEYGDGVLSISPPEPEVCDKYTYSPGNPTPDAFSTSRVYSTLNYNGQIDGAADTQISASRRDVLVYQTAPLADPVEVTGPIEATIYAATSARDTDWFVRLTDVEPNGKSLLLAEGAIRARNRDPATNGGFNSVQLSKIVPNLIYEYRITFWRDTANVFLKGHRIRAEISSSWYPFFLPNLNTGKETLADVSIREAVIAHQSICHGPQHPSYVLLPIISPPLATLTHAKHGLGTR
jgi:hypothetical protein